MADVASSSKTLHKGNQVGDWSIGRCIGAGGQGTVWEVRRVRGRSPRRALKASFSQDAQQRARFLREIRLLEECASPHVLPIVEKSEEWAAHVEGAAPFAYYVAELCDGTLRETATKLEDVSALLELFTQACDAVSFLHGRDNPVLHRDIKPTNFLVAPEPRRVVLADFGIAREENQETALTEINEVVGSRFFRAPEILSGSPATVRSDVYSMGRLLEWLLTGKLPEDLVPTPVPRGGRLSDDVCDLFDRILARASAVDPNQRYPTIQELRRALPRLWLDVRPQPSVPISDAPAMSSEEVRRTAAELARADDAVDGASSKGGSVERSHSPPANGGKSGNSEVWMMSTHSLWP